MTLSTPYIRTLMMLSLTVAGCGSIDDPNLASGSQSSTAKADDAAPTPTLPPAAANAWRLPWTCGHVYAVTQGNHGDICGVLGNHIGVEEFAWDFGLPMRTPILAARAGVVTLAANYSPPGSECHDGCPGALDSAGHALCCSKCLFSANRVNIQHDDGVVSSYSHFDELVVQKGQKVAAGDLLGYSGTSGCSTGPHLHFQVMLGCPTGYCQSLPIKFEDGGDPICGAKAISQNACR